MSEKSKIDYYLRSLDRVLDSVSPVRKAEIITDVKSRIDSLCASGLSEDLALAQLGSVDQVAGTYGVKYAPKTNRILRITKWVVLVSFLFFITFVAGAWWFIHDFINTTSNFEFHINEDQFTLGGHPGVKYNDEESLFEDTKDVQALGLKRLEFKFSNGKVRYSVSNDTQVSWRCKITGIDGEGRTTVENETLTVNIVEALISKCDVKIPKGLSLISKGGNGEVQLVEPQFDIDLKLGNGTVDIGPKGDQDYIYDLEIVNGRVEEFTSSQKPNAKTIKIRMTNGTIQKLSD